MQTPLDEIVRLQKSGQARGLASICSAHPWVLRAAVQNATAAGRPLLVEATCNQVNQYGGYTGLTPSTFARQLRRLAAENGLPPGQLILGGDHLGPNPWQAEPAESAMEKSRAMIRAYVRAGFTKIHLDASMSLGDDPAGGLPVEVIAGRSAQLAAAAEAACKEFSPRRAQRNYKEDRQKDSSDLRYVIGSEVPAPGGIRGSRHRVEVTQVDCARETLEAHRVAFKATGLAEAWERVMALVVQPGVEFGNDFVADYRPEAAGELSRFIEGEPGLVYEVHSTDYQTPQNLRSLVCDHFAFLKVGPALTFAFREGVFALAGIEDELIPRADRSNLIASLDLAMRRNPGHWKRYYPASLPAQALACRYSLSDRIRYYWPVAEVQHALKKLLKNLRRAAIPPGLLRQFLPEEYEYFREKDQPPSPEAILLRHITSVLADYDYACS